MKPGLTLYVSPGSDIAEAAREAQGVADKLDRAVDFAFNSVRCVAWPGGKADTLAQAYSDAQRSEMVAYSNSAKVELEQKWDRR